MRAEVSFSVSTLAQAREQADTAFREFFGETKFEIYDEEAEAETVVASYKSGDVRIVTWRCKFMAVAPSEAAE